MAEAKADVKPEAASSPAQGVTEAPPTSSDVTSAPSAEPKHEDAIPYSRFKEQVDKMKQLEAELAEEREMRQRIEDAKTSEYEWNLFGQQQAAQQQPQPTAQQPQYPYSPEEIEARIREDIEQKPFQTLWPIMKEAARQELIEQKKKESQVRSIPGFREYEDTYYEVPDDMIAQAQSNPEVIRFLLAKHRATLKGNPAPKAPQKVTAEPPPDNGKPALSMEELAEKYRREGEQRALENLRRQQGTTAEGAQTYSAPPSDNYELDDEGRSLMSKLGIPQDKLGKVAGRLANFMKGE